MVEPARLRRVVAVRVDIWADENPLSRCIQGKRPKKAGRGKRGPRCKLGVDASQWTLGSPGSFRPWSVS